jgi:CRISPR/Cas system-associated exonuclease Cas4 (RecB family)
VSPNRVKGSWTLPPKLIDQLSARFTKPEPLTPIQQLVDDTTTTLPSGFVKRVVDMRDSMPELKRTGQPGYVHLSELVRLCARQHCLMVDSGIAQEMTIVGAHRVLWKIGRAVEHHVRSQLIDGIPTEILGKWSCVCGETTFTGHRPDRSCPRCGSRINRYHEYTLFDHENGVVGNPDVILRHRDRYVPVEIKSMVKTDWEELRGPKGDHIIQAIGYRRLLQVNGFPVHNDVALIYTSKDFAWGSPYKEFHVRVTPRLEQQLDDLFAEAKRVKEWVTTQRLPERTCCTHQTGRRAKDCPVADRCFARN